MIYALPEKYLNNNYKMHFRAICMQKFAFFRYKACLLQ